MRSTHVHCDDLDNLATRGTINPIYIPSLSHKKYDNDGLCCLCGSQNVIMIYLS